MEVQPGHLRVRLASLLTRLQRQPAEHQPRVLGLFEFEGNLWAESAPGRGG